MAAAGTVSGRGNGSMEAESESTVRFPPVRTATPSSRQARSATKRQGKYKRNPVGGLIIEGTTGALYGTSVTPTADFTVPAGDTVAIETARYSAAQTLTVASGMG